jgi:hypothetical protein
LRLSPHGEYSLVIGETARKAFVAAIVVGAVVAGALALWKTVLFAAKGVE